MDQIEGPAKAVSTGSATSFSTRTAPTRTGNGPRVLASLRNLAITILR